MALSHSTCSEQTAVLSVPGSTFMESGSGRGDGSRVHDAWLLAVIIQYESLMGVNGPFARNSSSRSYRCWCLKRNVLDPRISIRDALSPSVTTSVSAGSC